MIIPFVASILFFTFIGLLSIIKNKHTNADYLLAGSSIKPWLVAISAVATSNSGYMFIGMIGYTYKYGLSSVWIMFGFIFGDFLSSIFIHKKIRMKTSQRGVLSFAGILSQWTAGEYKYLRLLLGLISVIFLGGYAAAQLNAGSKALHVLFNWHYAIGAIVGAVIVVAYCSVGGIRASIWTDAAQSFVMMGAMLMLFCVAIYNIGGVLLLVEKASAVSPEYFSLIPHHMALNSLLGALLFVIGWTFAGFGVIGQPHIMVRFMTMDTPRSINKVRAYYYAFYTVFSILTIGVGLCARLLLQNTATFDAELALPILALQILPPSLVGVMLAGLFAATMSTADSQILCCTAAITRDIFQHKTPYWLTKISTVIITGIALAFALFGTQNVFELTTMTWSVLAAAFAPLLLIYVLGGKPTERVSIAIVVIGIACTLMHRALGYNVYIHAVVPGMVGGILVWAINWYINKRKIISS
ncbi:MAG: sodium/proline symporter [Proteobacteria bacterium]|nr:sodium/proline symporter [Pseudomonadota bacterium]